MSREFGLPNDGNVEFEDSLYERVACQDGVERSTGSVKVTPSVLDALEAEYPKDSLPTDVPSVDTVSPFSLGEEEQFTVYESDNFTEENRLEGALWTAIQTNRLGITSEDEVEIHKEPNGVVVGSFPRFYDVKEMSLYCPELDYAVMEAYNQEGPTKYLIYDFCTDQIEYTINWSRLNFYDVPDEILMEMLPEEYNTGIVSHEI